MIPVFYDACQNAVSESRVSPSASKPVQAVASWSAQGFPIDLRGFAPATPEVIALAHDGDYVDGVFAGRVPNGFGSTSAALAASLPWTVGSLVAAAQWVGRRGGVACSPTSGFHHAGHAAGGGYCTFNGLVVAALVLRAAGHSRVGILDLDFHWGNGTDDILHCLGVTDNVLHYSFGDETQFDGGPDGRIAGPDVVERWLVRLPGIVRAFYTGGCRVMLYQASADPHVDDPLGGVMTTQQMRRRDRIVFRTCAAYGMGVVWNLAGGYQSPLRRVLDLHDATMDECVAAFRATPVQDLAAPGGLRQPSGFEQEVSCGE